MKRVFVLLAALAVIASALVLTVTPTAAELPECSDMTLTYTHVHDHPGGWGSYAVSLAWGAHPDAASYEIRISPVDKWEPVIFDASKANEDWFTVPASAFTGSGQFDVIVVAKDAAGYEICYTKNTVGSLELAAWNPPEAPKPPLPTWLGISHEPPSDPWAACNALCPGLLGGCGGTCAMLGPGGKICRNPVTGLCQPTPVGPPCPPGWATMPC